MKILLGASRPIAADPRCPCCTALLTGITPAGRRGNEPAKLPNPGDWTVCIYCSEILRFGEGLALQKPTPAEMLTLEADDMEMLDTMVQIVKAMVADRLDSL
jgi:hypothetical protein